MRHSIFTVPNPEFEDSPTEYTAILTKGGKVEVYVETVKDFGDGGVDFANVTFLLPDREVKNSSGLSGSEILDFSRHVYGQAEDIVDYVREEEDYV